MKTRYRLQNESRLGGDVVDELVRFAFAETPTIERLVAVRVSDGSGPGGSAARGASRPKWAGRARYALAARVAPDGHPSIGTPRVCWHSTVMKAHWKNEYERAWRLSPHLDRDDEETVAVVHARTVGATYRWVGELAAAGETRVGRFPIYQVDDVVEALLHVLAHEAMHVLAFDRDRRRNRSSEVHVEEHALRVLDAWRSR